MVTSSRIRSSLCARTSGSPTCQGIRAISALVTGLRARPAPSFKSRSLPRRWRARCAKRSMQRLRATAARKNPSSQRARRWGSAGLDLQIGERRLAASAVTGDGEAARRRRHEPHGGHGSRRELLFDVVAVPMYRERRVRGQAQDEIIALADHDQLLLDRERSPPDREIELLPARLPLAAARGTPQGQADHPGTRELMPLLHGPPLAYGYDTALKRL